MQNYGLLIIIGIILLADIWALCTLDWKWQPKNKNIIYTKEMLLEMDGLEFESFMAQVFRDMGYSATVTSSTNDGGKDIILYKDGVTTYVECKRYTDGDISRPLAQKLVGSAVGDGVKSILFVTTSKFLDTTYDYICDVNKNSDIKFESMDCDELLWKLNNLYAIEDNMILEG